MSKLAIFAELYVRLIIRCNNAWLTVFSREQTCSNLEMMDGFRQLTIAALSRYIDWSSLIAILNNGFICIMDMLNIQRVNRMK